MGDFDNSFGNFDFSNLSNSRIDEIMRQMDDKTPKSPKEREKELLYKKLFSELQSVLKNVEHKSYQAIYIDLFPRLKKLLNALIFISEHRIDKEIEFLSEMSFTWNQIRAILAKNPSLVDKKIHHILEDIHAYSCNSPYTFGYYLSEQVGEKWIPFPFLEMLQNLYDDHQTHQEKSLLHSWISKLQSVVDKQPSVPS